MRPIEGQQRLAEGESIEMAGDHVLHSFDPFRLLGYYGDMMHIANYVRFVLARGCEPCGEFAFMSHNSELTISCIMKIIHFVDNEI